MNLLKILITDYGYIMLYILSVLIACIVMGKQWVKAKAYSLMLIAKQKAKEGILKGGEQQEIWATKALYIVLKRLKIPFITEENLRPLVHKLYVRALDYLDDGQLNNSTV